MTGAGGRLSLMDRHGRSRAVVVISPVRRWWGLWLRLSWPSADRLPFLKRTLVQLSFIHVAHWSLLSRSPPVGHDRRRLPHAYLIFQSNFNDDLTAYIDAFALIVPWRMRLMWGGAYGFPGPSVVDRFVQFVLDAATPVQHYYSGYPDGSARTITDGLELTERHDRFAREVAGLTDAEFTDAWNRFVAENQRLL
jgi:hypothetical protein